MNYQDLWENQPSKSATVNSIRDWYINDEFRPVVVQGFHGYGKSSFAAYVASEIYGTWAWSTLKEYIVFHPKEFLNKIMKNNLSNDQIFELSMRSSKKYCETCLNELCIKIYSDYLYEDPPLNGYYDKTEFQFILSPKDYEINQQNEWLMIGNAGSDGIEFGIKKGHKKIYAYYPIEEDYSVKANSINDLINGLCSGSITV